MAAAMPNLRNTLKKLRAIEARIGEAYEPLETGQEMLDFLAVLDGLKPVFLHGRGIADPAWMEGVLAVAESAALRVVQGPCWNVLPPGESFPAWYADSIAAEFAPHRPFYICKSPGVWRAVEAVCAGGGRPTIAEEAALLGYPECCVSAHHARAGAYHRFVISRIETVAGGDEARMRELFASEIDLAPRDEDETRALEVAFDLVPCPFGSWNLCERCRTEEESPSAVLSDRYAALAEAVDPALYRLLEPPETA